MATVCSLAVLGGLMVGTSEAANGPTPTFFDLTARDGTILKTLIITPGTPGPHPLVVMPSAWGGADFQDSLIGLKFAQRGYIFVGYATRGFNGSGGEVDAVGPQSINDAEDVLDWSLTHNRITPGGVAFTGQSLAAGIGLIAAAKDPRIRAVAAVSAWGTLAEAVNQNDTSTDLVVAGLVISGISNGKLSAETTGILQDLLTHTNQAKVNAWAVARSPSTYVSLLNKNKTALFFASGENETVFPTGQTVDFFNKLTVPRRLELRPGDHATAEGPATLGIDSPVFDDAFDWFDSYVAHTRPAPAKQSSVMIIPESSDGAKPVEERKNWASVSTRSVRYPLGAQQGFDRTGTIGATAATTWTNTIIGGYDTPANVGIPLLTYMLEANTGKPPTTIMPTIMRMNAGVWQSGSLSQDRKLRGRTQLHVGVKPTTAAGSLFAYLYDVDASGLTGYSIASVPYTWTGKKPGTSFPLTLQFPALGYDIAKGHHLAVVIDTKDLLYHDRTTTGAPLSFTSTATDPAYLQLPLR